MSLQISQRNETRLREEAQRQGVSVDALIERLMSERTANPSASAPPAR
jgi:predicted HicB family RNase H-like nuclease